MRVTHNAGSGAVVERGLRASTWTAMMVRWRVAGLRTQSQNLRNSLLTSGGVSMQWRTAAGSVGLEGLSAYDRLRSRPNCDFPKHSPSVTNPSCNQRHANALIDIREHSRSLGHHGGVPDQTLWSAKPHTLAKHELLRRYLGAWYPILTQQGYHGRVVFIDGFAGPGVYQSGEEGSPIVALRTLVQHDAFQSMKGKFVFLFIEREEERMANLKVEIAAFWASVGGQPGNVVVLVEQGEFEQVTSSLLDSLKESGNVLAPTVAFVDPFGFAGVSLDAICRLTSFPSCEVIFSFMYDSLNRWVTHPTDSIHEHLRSLFGSEAYRGAVGLVPSERKAFLHDLYKHQLLEVGNFKYVLDFEMIDGRGKSVYSLFFGTRHIRGLEAMKSAMWSLDPSGKFRFSDRHAGQTSLFGEAINVEALRQAILVEFAGKKISIERIHEFVLAETIYGPSHYKVKVLKPLQQEGLLEAVSGQKRRGTFPEGTVIRFKAAET